MDYHEHVRSRMLRRGVTEADVEHTLDLGWPCSDADAGRNCKTFVFEFNADYDGRWYAEKEVTVYYTEANGRTYSDYG